MNFSQAALVPGLPVTPGGTVNRASWWRCFFAAFGACMLTLTVLWTAAGLTIGVMVPFAGLVVVGIEDIADLLLTLLVCMMVFFPVPVAFAIICAVIATGCRNSHLMDPVRARRRARLRGFQLGLCIGGPALVFVTLFRSSF